MSLKINRDNFILAFSFVFAFLRFYGSKSLPEAIDLIMKSLEVIESFKNNITDSNKKFSRALKGETKSFESLELTLWTNVKLMYHIVQFRVRKNRKYF